MLKSYIRPRYKENRYKIQIRSQNTEKLKNTERIFEYTKIKKYRDHKNREM